MDWSSATGWWVAAGVLVAAEMATGTFYLLMLALGLAAAALAAHAGGSLSAQLLSAAIVGGGAVAVWHGLRRRGEPAANDRDVNLDIGERVQVSAWLPDGSTRIIHRGCEWNARYAGEGDPRPGEHVIRGVDGNRLLLGR